MTKEQFESIVSEYGASLGNIDALNKAIGYIQSCDGGIVVVSDNKDDVPRICGYHEGSNSIIFDDYYYEGTIRTNQKVKVYLTLDNIQLIAMMSSGYHKPEFYPKETLVDEYGDRFKY